MIGRRGEIVWKKDGFVGGGGKRDYDAFQGWEMILPLSCVSLVHSFGWSQGSATAKAIPLRYDRAFAKRAMIHDWSGVLCVLSGLAFLPLLCSGYSVALTIVTGLVLIGSIAGLIVARSSGRDRDIRLILGRHTWGSSDPATWHKSLLEGVVDPQEKFEAESFAVLAEEFMDERNWADAMWAARLCCALEDRKAGEELTDAILSEPKVRKRLFAVRLHPEDREEEFGNAPKLSNWVRGDLKAAIFEIEG